jgi:ankyrin repeat protein
MTDANTDDARMVAARTSGDEATVRELLRQTPPLARQVPAGPLAPLHYAAREGHASIVQLLLEHGGAIELPDDQPWTTARFWAKHLEEPAIMQALAD